MTFLKSLFAARLQAKKNRVWKNTEVQGDVQYLKK
jgi:hypothetical protein